ncbi:hypothetical protein [Paraprevotella xylaniphila]|uniref:hypothetical protein n=1 Tax=Paraprevotella xylaniphila TaxID=454155 RepID=UPI00266C6EA0|nr:hypothetical protein [Paraprevotella xylaniphila]
MKNILKTIIYSLFIFFITSKLYAQETEMLVFAEKFTKSSSASTVQPILPKVERLSSSQRGSIEMIMGDDIPDSVRVCANVAAELWQSYLNNKYPIRLDVSYVDLDSENDIEIEVLYRPGDIYYPTSLYAHLFDVDLGGEEGKADAYIFINKSKEWDCSHNKEINASTRNLTYAMMRAIAVSLGFGSSVTQKTIRGNDIIAFGKSEGHSVFDNLIFSSQGKSLKDITNIGNRQNSELTNYVQPTQGTNLYALKQDEKHKLYAPENFEIYKSLVYLDNKESLMHHDLKTGTKQFRVDATTIELLDAIGWGINTPSEVEIIGEGIDENGLASAYESHTFTLQNHNGGTITDALWTYALPLQNGKDTVISQSSNSLPFNIEAIDNEDKYRINMNGDISGKIIFTGKINGKEVKDIFYLSLELKPRIKAVNIIKKESNAPLDSYNLYYTVEYVGSDHLFIQIEEEYGTGASSKFVYEPFFAHVVSKYIIAPFYNWVDITVENEYGKDIYTIELPPYTGSDTKALPLNKPEVKNRYTYIEVFDKQGRKITRIEDLNELRMQKQGLYILKFYKDTTCVKTTKYLKP